MSLYFHEGILFWKECCCPHRASWMHRAYCRHHEICLQRDVAHVLCRWWLWQSGWSSFLHIFVDLEWIVTIRPDWFWWPPIFMVCNAFEASYDELVPKSNVEFLRKMGLFTKFMFAAGITVWTLLQEILALIQHKQISGIFHWPMGNCAAGPMYFLVQTHWCHPLQSLNSKVQQYPPSTKSADTFWMTFCWEQYVS